MQQYISIYRYIFCRVTTKNWQHFILISNFWKGIDWIISFTHTLNKEGVYWFLLQVHFDKFLLMFIRNKKLNHGAFELCHFVYISFEYPTLFKRWHIKHLINIFFLIFIIFIQIVFTTNTAPITTSLNFYLFLIWDLIDF
jgi:hypothetical protein